MPKRPVWDGLPGNDGRWFLELVGVVEPSPAPTDTYATLEALVPPPAPDDTSTLSGAAVATAVNGALAGTEAGNGEFVAAGPPGVSALRDDSRRRWPWLAVGVVSIVLIAAGAAGAYLLPNEVEKQAAVLAAGYREALIEMRNELPETQRALADLTDPGAPDDVLAAVPAALAELNTVSGRTVATATGPLPGTLPFVPRDLLEALEPSRATMTVLGANGRDLAHRLGVGFTYRTTVESLFAVTSLPTEAPDDTVTELSLALATDLADTGRLVADLPPDPTFLEVRDAALNASERYATWQLEYLDALRRDDADRARNLVAERGAAVAELSSMLDGALSEMRSELDPLIVVLAAELEAVIGQLN